VVLARSGPSKKWSQQEVLLYLVCLCRVNVKLTTQNDAILNKVYSNVKNRWSSKKNLSQGQG